MSYSTISTIKRYTDTTPEQREDLFHWFATMTEAEQIHVLELQRDLLRRLAGQQTNPSPMIALATLAEALSKRAATLDILTNKYFEGDETQNLKILTKIRIDAFTKGRPEGKKERQYRIQLHGLVQELRDSNLSWRNCATYLKKHHRYTISHQRLMQLFKKYSKEE
ncbi:protein of unknown function [Pseudodesulfovibrio piezophilus C1TLV30]|uniref:Uncharacterized protein n=1 Tax=Pseudodesulfovibrio piezophilus (strain DSM 21447 / JCM 15486 / C1TLV30) TaxID=1322246 RepID=M1WQT5_PSEP2|nr:protein of unknown function [Pseudodesulfovibrio piezophilus C1TLV30]